MEAIIKFAANNYIMLIIVTLFLIFSLVGCLVTAKNKKDSPFKIAANTNTEEELNLESLDVDSNLSLQDMVKEKATIKQEEMLDDNNPPML